MRFDDPEVPLSEIELARLEAEVGLKFPAALRRDYLAANGGSPQSYVYEDSNLETVVSEFLPLTSLRGTGTAIDTYRNLVIQKHILPENFFPFAVDGGGDYFFADCKTPDGMVHFYRSEAVHAPKLLPLNIGVDEFWSRLKDEP